MAEISGLHFQDIHAGVESFIVHRTKKLLVRTTSVRSYLIIFQKANRVDPDQAALTTIA